MRARAGSQLVLVVALALVVGGCSSKKDTSEEGSSGGAKTVTLGGQPANSHGTKNVSGGANVEVEVDDFYFNPTVFAGHAGDHLTLKLANESKTLHNFTLTAQGIDKDIPAGSSVTVSVTLPESGTMVFFCKFHQASGMRGGLRVE